MDKKLEYGGGKARECSNCGGIITGSTICKCNKLKKKMENNDIICIKGLNNQIQDLEQRIDSYDGELDDYNYAFMEGQLYILKQLLLQGFDGKEVFEASRKAKDITGVYTLLDCLVEEDIAEYRDYEEYLTKLIEK